MTYTDKRLEEYCKKFGLCKEKGTCQCKEELKFIADLITQALAEERERVEKEIKYILDFAESDKEMADNPEDPKVRINYFRDRLDEILDKPLQEKETTKYELPQFKETMEALDKLTIIKKD